MTAPTTAPAPSPRAPAAPADALGARPSAVALRGVRFAYGGRRGGPRSPVVLDVPELVVSASARVFVHGPSGSGKTTLLGLVAGVLAPQAGAVEVLGTDLARLRPAARDAFRGEHVGYVFQQFNLIPYLTARDNVTLPCRLSARRRARLGEQELDAAALEVARRLDIADLLDERADRLSVGQQQRVACARALLGAPGLVVCDEPTSALDADRRARFLALLFDSVAAAGAALLFVSHDRALEPLFDATVSLPAVNRAARAAAD